MSTQTACFDTFVYLDNNFNIDALIDFRINIWAINTKTILILMHNDENLINDKSDNFGIYMATKYYEDDTDSFAYKENIINGKDKWNVDTVIQAMNEGFKIIMEEE